MKNSNITKISLIALFIALFLTKISYGQSSVTPDPGIGATIAGFEVDADYKSGHVPPFWNSSNYLNYGTFGDDWSHGSTFSAVLKQLGGVSVPGVTADGSAIWQVDGNWGNKAAVAENVSFSGT